MIPTLLMALAALPPAPPADVLVYGGSPAAVAAAVESARLGRRVLLLSPERHVGGM